MNSVVRQFLEQDTDVVMVDTGDSYEGICAYFEGTYITYSKEHPISMNPFRITEEEYRLNFGEKKNFLKSLLFLIYKGSEAPTKIEDKIINQTLVEYYEEYFHPFRSYTDGDRKRLREKLLLEDKKNGNYERYEEKIEEKYGDPYAIPELERGQGGGDPAQGDAEVYTPEEKEHHAKIVRQVDKLHNLVNDSAATQGEKDAANRQLMRLMPELIEGHYLMRIEKRIDRMEQQRKKMHVDRLNFNSYYEFALERIPQIMKESSIDFDINAFAAILEQFYKGGELEHTLNNDVDASLFNEKFIVFEIDKIKDDPVLFPIVVLIIMDVFLQKMRLKKGRKALIIEEAWKAISSPTMAEYIKYLYKTVRKFHGIAGVVTQELNDVIDSPIVKETIINNSDIKILLDQSKFKDRYGEIAAILGLTQVQKQQIFTINALPNHEGRSYFKEVWICRGQQSDVYGVEEPPECYWQQRSSDFPGMKRQYLFHDMRYARVFDQVLSRFDRYSDNPLHDIGFERVPGRSFRLQGTDNVDTLLAGTQAAAGRFRDVRMESEMLYMQLPECRQQFFYDNLLGYASFMERLNLSLNDFLMAYKEQGNKDLRQQFLQHSIIELSMASKYLHLTQHDAFLHWYEGERLWGFDTKLLAMKNRLHE